MIDGYRFELSDIVSYLFKDKKVEISNADKEVLEKSYNFLSEYSKERVIYGINTGFGPMAQYRIEDKDLIALQYNIIRSHSTGAGNNIDNIYVKAALIARLNTFLKGKSGVHTDLIDLLVGFINNEIYPLIPEHGGVGASGDLVQMAHIGLALIGEGEVSYKGEVCMSDVVMKQCGLTPLKLHIREGLAIVNGTSVMTGISLVNVIRSKQILNWSILASVMMNEIASSYGDFMAEELNGVKLHKGQSKVAQMMRELTVNSSLIRNRENLLADEGKDKDIFKHKVQPYYSLRCVPQILGVVLDQIEGSEQVVLDELNSVSDNPIVDADTQNVYHGGNFHGDYISFEMDKLKIAITKLTMLSERQINYLFHDRINGILPPFVNLGVLGLNYGLQASQFTATSTTAESQTLSNPMYVHSIPNNNDNQDIVSMGTNSALITKKIIENSYQVMAIQFMAIVQAVDCLKAADKLSSKTRLIYDEIRAFFPVFIEDTPKHKDIERMISYLIKKENII